MPDRKGNHAADSGSLIPFRLITNRDTWSECYHHLQQQPRLAIDLEANSLYAYRERVCLIQISTSTADYIIDPIPDYDLGRLGELLANPQIEKVFHAAEYDLILLKRDYGWQLNNLFDTMWAARILGYTQIGLASLLDQHFGIQMTKRFQKANWCHRPLNDAELAYAQMDTHYLLDLRDRLEAELERQGRTEEATEIFAEQSQVRMPANGFDPDGFWSLNGTHDLTAAQKAALKSLYLFRDQEAKRRNHPPFKVLSDRTLLELAEQMPASQRDLETIHGMSAGQRNRYSRHLLALIAEARQSPAPVQPKRPPRPPDAVLNRFDRLHRWRKQKAQERGVESDVIMSRDALWSIAQNNPASLEALQSLGVFGPWRYQTYGEEVLRLLRGR